jgi:integrase
MPTAFKKRTPLEFQLGGKVLPTQPVSSVSSFGDDLWDLGSLNYLKNQSARKWVIDFSITLADGSILTEPANAAVYLGFKEYLYARLHNPPNGYPPAKPYTIVHEFNLVVTFIRWMFIEDMTAYSQLRPKDIEIDFLAFLKKTTTHIGNSKTPVHRSEMRIYRILAVVQRLWHFRERMTDSLIFNPFAGKSPFAVLGLKHKQSYENTTPIIPDDVMEALAIAALDYVRIYSADILYTRSVADDYTRRFEEQYGRQIRATDKDYYRHLNQIKAILSTVPISMKPGANEPWRPYFSSPQEVRKEEHLLFIACYIVVAWLTGMRDSEITSMREGCLYVERSSDGVVERYRIRATLFKNMPDKKGREESWVAIEPVAQAIEVLERLTKPLRLQSGKKDLFLSGKKGINVPSTPAINVGLRLFAKHAGVPLVDGKPWLLSTRQFRRTLARWIARRPFGEIAGMMQFKHIQMATFEGYVGADPGWRKDLEQEKLLADIERLEDLEIDILNGTVAGPKGLELVESFRGVAGDRRHDDERYMLKHLAKTLFVGPFNLCFYEPAFALCQQHMPEKDRHTPVTSHCKPNLCPNSCITKEHLPAWEAQLVEIQRLRKGPKIPVPQRAALDQEAAKIERIIAPLRESRG